LHGAVAKDVVSAHEGVGDFGTHLETFEGGVLLSRLRLFGAHRPRDAWIDQAKVSVESDGHVALGVETKALRRVAGDEFGDAPQRQSAPRSLSDEPG
jgi:hypothetical protein